MSAIILCAATAINIFSLPAGNNVVWAAPPGPPGQPFQVRVLDTSMFRDWVFIGTPFGKAVVPLGWVRYDNLMVCPPQRQTPGQDGCPDTDCR